ncbi:MAG TPA: hypothetical protein VMY42_19700 [Thermoguttaceae bacterium]|nr:hypothetical protein [Thermoguttaceae bacterium]
MTLQPYGPEKLDEFALNLLDLAAIMRKMANESRERGVTDLALHDKKAQYWYGNLSNWVHKVQSDLEVRILQSRAKRRAKTAGL